MSVGYTWVQWSRAKTRYDLAIAAGVGLYLAVFVAAGMILFRPPNDVSPTILLIRALGTCAIVMLHVILLIGPLARLTDRVAPLLYNRRHLGVSFFFVALTHAALSTLYYGGGGERNPLLGILTSYDSFASLRGFPFELLGFLALIVFFLMAATSHDFWLKNLSPKTWKRLHMLVYAAYALVLAHVALGALQSEKSVVYPVLIGVGFAAVAGAHIAAGVKEWGRDRRRSAASEDGWVRACEADSLADGAGRVVTLPDGTRAAIFRHGANVSAMSNVCAHQGGPLGEGRVIDGCVTCPWHGYQYEPENGQSPPPFTEKVPTHRVKVEGGAVLIDPNALAPGTRVEPARIDAPHESPHEKKNERENGAL